MAEKDKENSGSEDQNQPSELPPPLPSPPPLPPTQKDIVVYDGLTEREREREHQVGDSSASYNEPKTDAGSASFPPPPLPPQAGTQPGGYIPDARKTISILIISAGILSFIVSISVLLLSGCMCFYVPIFALMGCGYLYEGIRLQNDLSIPVPTWIPYAMCAHLIGCDPFTMGLGIVIILMMHSEDYKNWYG